VATKGIITIDTRSFIKKNVNNKRRSLGERETARLPAASSVPLHLTGLPTQLLHMGERTS
jgi:hypothetical protein